MLQHNASLREFLYQFSHSTLDDVGIVTKLVQDPLYIRRRQKERIQLAKAAQDPSLKKRRPNDDVLLSRISEIHLDNRLRLAAMREGSAIKLDIFPDYHLTENYLFELKQGQLRVNVQERGIDWTEYDALAKFDDLYGLFEVKLNSTMQKGRTKRVKKRGKYRTVDRMRESKFGTIRTKASGGGLNYCMSDVRIAYLFDPLKELFPGGKFAYVLITYPQMRRYGGIQKKFRKKGGLNTSFIMDRDDFQAEVLFLSRKYDL